MGEIVNEIEKEIAVGVLETIMPKVAPLIKPVAKKVKKWMKKEDKMLLLFLRDEELILVVSDESSTDVDLPTGKFKAIPLTKIIDSLSDGSIMDLIEKED